MNDQNHSNKEQKNALTTRLVIAIAVEFGFIIAIPLVVFGFFGKWMANRYDNKLFIAASLVLSLLISTIFLYRQINQLYKKLTE